MPLKNRTKVIHKTRDASANKVFDFWLFRIYCLIDQYFVYEGMVCSSTELYYSGSIFTNSSQTIEIKGRIFANLSWALILSFFTKCKHLRSSWQRLRGITFAILRQRSFRFQYDLYDGSCTNPILMLILIKYIISARFVSMDLRIV